MEFGDRPTHIPWIDKACPSRNRKNVLKAVAELFPDELELEIEFIAGIHCKPLSIRSLPAQFIADGLIWQEFIVRTPPGGAERPSAVAHDQTELITSEAIIDSAAAPGLIRKTTTANDRESGIQRYYLPIRELADDNNPVRQIGPDPRPEHHHIVVKDVELSIEFPDPVNVHVPVFETLGRLAPYREHRPARIPTWKEVESSIPSVKLPAEWSGLQTAYTYAWKMLLDLLENPAPESGLPGCFLRTAQEGFDHKQFVWDSAFSTMALAYAWRVAPVYGSLDNMYSRQFDGGYIHRNIDTRYGTIDLFEPDFSPNPPIMAVAEWKLFELTGNTHRLKQVYPALKAHFQWLEHNRRLDNGTFWTTGLANGLDNSPSLGDGYPDLTSQMAHFAEIMADIAELLGIEKDALEWRKQYSEIRDALNTRLWSESMRFYSTSLPEGGHNSNKVATGFWPLWAGAVPEDRVEALAEHLTDESSFWRLNPVPSLAADSPQFSPDGSYWLGSTWAPTNYATISGFWRAGRHELARKTALKHLDALVKTLKETGTLWENYCSEQPGPGNWSQRDYSWTALSPINLLLEVVLGLTPKASDRTLVWHPPTNKAIRIQRYPLGRATLSLSQHADKDGHHYSVNTDSPIKLILNIDGKSHRQDFEPGETWFSIPHGQDEAAKQ